MKPTDIAVKTLIRENLFRIPIYQRSYVWTKKDWENLWKDIIGVAEKKYREHFIGSIIFTKEQEPVAQKEEYQNDEEKETVDVCGYRRSATSHDIHAVRCRCLLLSCQ